MGRVEFRVRVGAVPISGSSGTEFGVAAFYSALMHLSEMDRAEVDFQGSLVAESLQADVALDAFLPCSRVYEGGSQIGGQVGSCPPLTAFSGRLGLSSRNAVGPGKCGSRVEGNRRVSGGPFVLPSGVFAAQIEGAARVFVIVLRFRADFADALLPSTEGEVSWRSQSGVELPDSMVGKVYGKVRGQGPGGSGDCQRMAEG